MLRVGSIKDTIGKTISSLFGHSGANPRISESEATQSKPEYKYDPAKDYSISSPAGIRNRINMNLVDVNKWRRKVGVNELDFETFKAQLDSGSHLEAFWDNDLLVKRLRHELDRVNGLREGRGQDPMTMQDLVDQLELEQGRMKRTTGRNIPFIERQLMGTMPPPPNPYKKSSLV